MAAGDSIVSICNIALIALGEDPIVSLEDNSKPAILCKARYDDCRRLVLRSHPWSCAKKMVALAASPTPPLTDYANAFPLPADWIRNINLPDDDSIQFEVMNGQLLTDDPAPLNFLYIFDLQDPTLFDPLMIHALAYYLAWELAVPLTQDKAKKDDMWQAYGQKIADARLINAQDDTPVEWDADVWLRSRV